MKGIFKKILKIQKNVTRKYNEKVISIVDERNLKADVIIKQQLLEEEKLKDDFKQHNWEKDTKGAFTKGLTPPGYYTFDLTDNPLIDDHLRVYLNALNAGIRYFQDYPFITELEEKNPILLVEKMLDVERLRKMEITPKFEKEEHFSEYNVVEYEKEKKLYIHKADNEVYKFVLQHGRNLPDFIKSIFPTLEKHLTRGILFI
jgi:hypothetical protein